MNRIGRHPDSLAEPIDGLDIFYSNMDAVLRVSLFLFPFKLLRHAHIFLSNSRRYSLLLVFYSAALSDTRSRRPMRYAVVMNGVFLVICITISLLLKDPHASEKGKEIIEIIYFTFNALLDVIVVIGLSYFGYRFGRKQSSKKTVATRILPRSPKLFQYVNWVLVVMSVLRGIFNIALITLINRQERLEMIYYYSDGERKMTPYYLVLYFFAVEGVPAICIFVTLWKRPSSSSRRKDKNATPPSTAAERAAANSIDEHSGVIVRHFSPTDDSARSAPPAWWSTFITSTMGPDIGSFRSSDGPAINEDASDDEYVMFKGIVHTGSATGDAVQISNLTRNKLLINPSAASSISETGSFGGEGGYHATYAAHSGGPISIQTPQIFTQPAGSPLVGAAGTPPSFDAWIKQQRKESGSSVLTTPIRVGGNTITSEQQGSPLLTTPYVNVSQAIPKTAALPPPLSSSQISDSSSNFGHGGNSEFDIQSAGGRMSAISTGNPMRPSEGGSDCYQEKNFFSSNQPVRSIFPIVLYFL